MALLQSHALSRFTIPSPSIPISVNPPPSFSSRRDVRREASPLSSFTAGDFSVSSLTRPRRKLLCPPPRGKHVREDYLVKKLSAQEIQELVKGERNVPLIIDFYATWCGPCILMAQELEMLAVEYESNAMIVKVDTDDEYEFARDMQVRGLPTCFFISPDPTKDAIRTEGLIPIQMMRDIIDNEM
ncbi:PREDICTED: thioredoxin-like protein CITRX, chloroplastic [Tarenaya hassleriana]|uniref:thioredoxin-like protein CITRX, chloroplastic n=1 Tax=Tarenaya hassleriana TaxID=28532 RepID=UPI00053C6AB8|nr:PREDICTED: thioredoxin-like protein CITRX, chloroplastic [Tarenaya hassleriana]